MTSTAFSLVLRSGKATQATADSNPAADVIDVAQVIELSRSADLELPVRAGGHSS